ncbi:MAG: glycosyltransferase [Candidatus Omnitrophota bacterium]|nr:glycosyltransferase [Candidatus Omnitrophota bacterium]MBU1929457.1 glycosyltransferase [Candidatus Omnitrophota bacterium]MBU2034819.1 glycosyltransferase [Candidatus Omnitrophota bacterium]MBU2221172.1 glycosyltransferase [Candidatus Omnitrophota bacterium]MBU2258119.1 glycosyltransferase [Candidatus Omnitrophota bacterium]
MIEVSVIITTKNEAANIRDCLNSIKAQSFPRENIEVIIVDNNSVDETRKIAQVFTDKIFDHGPERSAQRNFGVNRAIGEYILYLDADMALSPMVISECVDKCRRENLIALYIPEQIVGKGFWIKVRNFERSFYNATVIDCVRFVRRDNILSISGFDESLTGPEDWDLDRKIRESGKVGIINSSINHNEGVFTLRKYLSKKSYYAANFRRYINKWGKDDPVIRKQFGLSYRYFGVFTENGKWLKLIFHPFLTIRMFFLRLSVGAVFLIKK